MLGRPYFSQQSLKILAMNKRLLELQINKTLTWTFHNLRRSNSLNVPVWRFVWWSERKSPWCSGLRTNLLEGTADAEPD